MLHLVSLSFVAPDKCHRWCSGQTAGASDFVARSLDTAAREGVRLRLLSSAPRAAAIVHYPFQTASSSSHFRFSPMHVCCGAVFPRVGCAPSPTRHPPLSVRVPWMGFFSAPLARGAPSRPVRCRHRAGAIGLGERKCREGVTTRVPFVCPVRGGGPRCVTLAPPGFVTAFSRTDSSGRMAPLTPSCLDTA